MLTRAKKKELRERLEDIAAGRAGDIGRLVAVMLEILEETPTQSEHEDAVAAFARRTIEELPPT